MRLIDADKLPYEDIESIDGNIYMCVNAYDIEHAPTIKQSEDCISREEVRQLICKNNDKYGYSNRFHEFTEECLKLPSATPRVEWIPVSERLPKNTGWYLITFKTANGVAVCELSYRKPENYWTDKDISKKVLDNNDILAWMPLPQPYKAESEE